MNIDLVGRIKNISLPYSKPLLPLFEAVINSFDAIEDSAKGRDGQISISILRDTRQTRLEIEGNEDISGFTITDNGIGFTSVNFDSFVTSDSEYKLSKGGKGIGRFLWLKAFDSVNIESKYFENDKWYERAFKFQLSEKGIQGGEAKQIQDRQTITRVDLMAFKDRYAKSCPKKANTIAFRLLEHCLSRFLDSKCPSVFLIDGKDSVSLNEIFLANYKKSAESRKIKIRGVTFDLLGLKLTSAEEQNHCMHLCANGREVTSTNLTTKIPNLTGKLHDETTGDFHFVCYLSGQYLDENVNQERTDFLFPDTAENDLVHPITLEDIFKEVSKEVTAILQPYLEPIQARKQEKIETHIQQQAPQFRHLAKYMTEELENIPPGVSDEKLDLELYKIRQKHELKLRQESDQFLKETAESEDSAEYSEQFSRFMEEITEAGKATLAEYIIHRRLVLNLLEHNLKKRADNKYPLEERVHEIIFPLRATSNEVPYDKQNLWLLDEKLCYHYYLASDLQFENIQPILIDNKKRPDILVFNHPIAFVDQGPPYSSVVVIEFKRPMRKDYDEVDDNPVAQIFDYIRDLRDGNKIDKDGRPIQPPSGIPFYAYVVADLTKKLQIIAENATLIRTPDSMGFFGYNKNLETYIEIISYDKMLLDAQKRNRVLFDKLNLPVKFTIPGVKMKSITEY